MAAIEAVLVFAIRSGVHDGIDWPAKLMAAFAALFLALGVLEQYLAIWKNQSVEGISFLFCGIDALGDVTSVVSVSFEPKLSILALVMYGVEFVLWVGVFACGAYFKFIPWIKRRFNRRQRRVSATNNETEPAERGISLYDLPSSTSVFRTASGVSDIRERRNQNPIDVT